MNTQKITTKGIVLMGVLMAMQLILTRFLSIQTPIVRIGFSFIPTAIMAMIFGPLLTGVGSTLSDFIGITLFPTVGGYFPGFSVSAFLSGAIYGWFFYKKEMTWQRILLANVIIVILIDMILNTFWLYLMMGPGVIAQIPLRVGKSLLLLPIKVGVIYGLGNQGVLKNQMARFQN